MGQYTFRVWKNLNPKKKIKKNITKINWRLFNFDTRLIDLVRLYSMEVEYTGGGVLIFSYLFPVHQRDNFGSLRWAEAAWYEWFDWLPLWWPANSEQTRFALSKLSRGSLIWWSSLAAALMAANSCSIMSAKRKRCKPPRSATD